MSEIRRNDLNSISYLLKKFPCVAILGARQVGKTTLLHHLLPHASFFDLENSQILDQIRLDPEFFIAKKTKPLVLDEAQNLPEIFKVLRIEIDKNRKQPGQFLISGSSSPLLLRHITESLAGRVALFELSPLVWSESWNKNGSLFYDNLLAKKFDQFLDLKPVWTQEELIESLFYGGYPEPFLKRTDKTFFDLWLQNYFETYIKRDVRNLFPGLALTTYQRFIKMLASSSGNLLNMSEFARSLDVSQPTIKNYFDIADGTFLWRNIPAFHSSKVKSLTRMPKGYIRDSGLTTFLMNVHEPQALQNHVRVGLVWECFVMEEIIRALKSRLCSFEYYHYRTKNNSEIDFMLEGPFGLIPVEIKYGQKTDLSQLRTLKLFVEQNHCAAGLVVNLSDKPLQLSEKIYQIPAGCL